LSVSMSMPVSVPVPASASNYAFVTCSMKRVMFA